MLDPDCLLTFLVRESPDGPSETCHCALIQWTGWMQLVDGAKSQPATEHGIDHGCAERQPTSLTVRPRKHPTQIEKRRDGHSSNIVRCLFYMDSAFLSYCQAPHFAPATQHRGIFPSSLTLKKHLILFSSLGLRKNR
jgi:hypothetical protein